MFNDRHLHCDKLSRIEHEEFAKRIDSENRRQNARIDKLEDTYKQLNEISVAVQTMSTNIVNMTASLEKTSQRLEKLEDSAINSAQLNGFGKRLDEIEKKTNDRLELLANNTDARLDAIERAPGHAAAQNWNDIKGYIVKTALGIIVAALVIAVGNAVLPHVVFR